MPVLTHEYLDDTWSEFSQKITALAAQLGLLDKPLDCDHVALRVNDIQAAKALSEHFCRQGSLISHNQINGRPIEIIELQQPLMLGKWSIACIELPYPGSKHYPQQGWEHIELVFPGDFTNCQALEVALVDTFPHLKPVLAEQTDIQVKRSSPQGQHERLANPTLAFKSNGICIKIHPHDIKAIIASEQSAD